jgi:hypothetical protein
MLSAPPHVRTQVAGSVAQSPDATDEQHLATRQWVSVQLIPSVPSTVMPSGVHAQAPFVHTPDTQSASLPHGSPASFDPSERQIPSQSVDVQSASVVHGTPSAPGAQAPLVQAFDMQAASDVHGPPSATEPTVTHFSALHAPLVHASAAWQGAPSGPGPHVPSQADSNRHWSLLVHGPPKGTSVHVPAEHRFVKHWSFAVQLEPVMRGEKHFPDRHSARGSAQSAAVVHGSPVLPASQTPLKHTSEAHSSSLVHGEPAGS